VSLLETLDADTSEAWVRRSVFVDLDPSIALHALERELPRGERALAESFPERRRRTFVGGRVALRRALAALGQRELGAIGVDARGAPILPRELCGSIAHKDEVAVAHAEWSLEGAKLGVDVELSRRLSEGVVRRVLCDDELTELEARGAEASSRAALERFAAKEAIYKAIDPFLCRYVGFREVRLREPSAGLLLAEGAAIEGLEVVARVARVPGPRGQPLVLAIARAWAR
jgi:enterobactin synthetase component D